MPIADYRPAPVSDMPTVKSYVPLAREWKFNFQEYCAERRIGRSTWLQSIEQAAQWSDILQMADYFLRYRSLPMDQILLTEYLKSKDPNFRGPSLTDCAWRDSTTHKQLSALGKRVVTTVDLTSLDTLVEIREFIEKFLGEHQQDLLKCFSLTNQDVLMMLVRFICYATPEICLSDFEVCQDPCVSSLRQLATTISTDEAYRVLGRNPAFLIGALTAIAHWRHGSAFIVGDTARTPTATEVADSFRYVNGMCDALSNVGGRVATLKAFLVFEPSEVRWIANEIAEDVSTTDLHSLTIFDKGCDDSEDAMFEPQPITASTITTSSGLIPISCEALQKLVDEAVDMEAPLSSWGKTVVDGTGCDLYSWLYHDILLSIKEDLASPVIKYYIDLSGKKEAEYKQQRGCFLRLLGIPY